MSDKTQDTPPGHEEADSPDTAKEKSSIFEREPVDIVAEAKKAAEAKGSEKDKGSFFGDPIEVEDKSEPTGEPGKKDQDEDIVADDGYKAIPKGSKTLPDLAKWSLVPVSSTQRFHPDQTRVLETKVSRYNLQDADSLKKYEAILNSERQGLINITSSTVVFSETSEKALIIWEKLAFLILNTALQPEHTIPPPTHG